MRQHAGAVVAGLVCLMAIIGIGIFILAFQECRFAPRPGSAWQYRLQTKLLAINETGELGQQLANIQHDLDLMCWSADNDIALLTTYRKGRGSAQEELSHIRISPKGEVSRYVDEELLHNSGQSVGHFFDFNLFPLPPGLEQTWTVPMVYGILPPQKNEVFATVRRVRNGSHPKFVLTFPPVAWVKRGPSDPYSQISDFRCEYSFDIARGIVEEAKITFIFARERPRPQRVQQVHVEMNLLLQDWGQFEDAVALRDTAMHGLDVQAALNQEHAEKLQVLLRRIPNDGKAMPQALQRYFSAIKQRVHDQLPSDRQEQGQRHVQAEQQPDRPEPVQSDPQKRYALQIASISQERRSAAEAEVKKLKRQGFDAFLGQRGNYYIICIGPYAEKKQHIHNDFTSRYPNNEPFWVKVR